MMRKLLFLTLFILLSISFASAGMSYFIDNDNNVWIPVTIAEGESFAYTIEKTPGYSPNGENVFDFYFGADSQEEYTTKFIGDTSTGVVNDGILTVTSSSSIYTYTVSEFNDSSIAELRQYTPFNSGNTYWGFRSGDGDASRFAGHLSVPNGRNWILYESSTVPTDWNTSDYVIRKMIWNNGALQWFDNGVECTNSPLAQSVSGSNPFEVSAEGNGVQYVDWIRIRKYVKNEPTVTVTDAGSYYIVEIEAVDELSDYQVMINGSELDISSTSESLLISPKPTVFITPNTENNSVTGNLQYSVSGFGLMNATMFIDGVSQGTEPIASGTNTYYPIVSQGTHTWYVNVSSEYNGEIAYNQTDSLLFIFDTIDPSILSSTIDPNYEKIANGTIVSIGIEWYDVNLKNASFFVDYGSGYVLEDNITFSGTSGWFNTSIDTTGYTGENISWYQIAYDEAGNNYTYSDSFLVILDQLSIYVFDESTGNSILPGQVRIYNTESSHFASINTETNVSTLSYNSVDSGKYIVSVTKDGYYARNSIIDVDITTLSELNMYLIDENQTVIYDQFNLIDYTRNYDYNDVIIRLDKPLTDGTQTVFSSYFDYAGTTATYLIATDQYILYIITPDSTISYGWLTPDADGEVDIVVNNYELTTSEEWLDYDYSFTESSLSFDYVSSKTIDQASLNISLDGVNIYSVSSESDSGSFLYNSFTQNGTYFVSIQVTAEDGTEFLKQEYKEIGDGEKVDLFPTSYSLLMKSVVVVLIMVTGVLVLSSYRFDLAAIWIASLYGLSVSQEWIYGNTITVAVMSLLCLAALVKFHRKQNRLV